MAKKEIKIGTPVWRVKINKVESTKTYSLSKEGVYIDKFEVLGISDYKICINDNWFSTFDKEKPGERRDLKYNSYLDEVSTSIRTKDSILDAGIFISLYSTKKPTKATLKKMVAKASIKIKEKYGFLSEGVNHSLYGLVDEYSN